MKDREKRASEVIERVLEGEDFGSILAVGVSTSVRAALPETTQIWERWGAQAAVHPPECQVDTVVLRLPKGKRSVAAMASLSASRLKSNGTLLLYGANDEGIKSCAKPLGSLFDSIETVDTRRHCRVLAASSPTPETQGGLDAWETQWTDSLQGRELHFKTLPGVFAEGRIDAGTRLLLEATRVDPEARVLDFGCGAGVIGAALGDRPGELVGLDLDAWAVHCASQNAPGHYVVSNAWSNMDESFDHIVSNPPFHAGNDVDLGLIAGLITEAPNHLVRGGKLTFVCPATAPVRRALEETFKTSRILAETRAFRVWEATT